MTHGQPSPYSSPPPSESPSEDEATGSRGAEGFRNARLFRESLRSRTTPSSPVDTRSGVSPKTSGPESIDRRQWSDERSSLMLHSESGHTSYRTLPATAPSTPHHSMRPSFARTISRRNSIGRKHQRPLGSGSFVSERGIPTTPLLSGFLDNRTWYDQFTSTDWIRDAIADAIRVKKLRSRRDLRGRAQALFDGAQGWILVALIGCITAGIAFVIDVSEAAVFDYKLGYCSTHWWYSQRKCCSGASKCDDWASWSSLRRHADDTNLWVDYTAFVVWVIGLSLLACLITLATKTSVSSHINLSTLDENLGADPYRKKSKQDEGATTSESPTRQHSHLARRPPMSYYPAAGSGVAEVKVILSGFVMHGYLGIRTLSCKSFALILSVASGLSIGKEGPYVHIATCVGNIACRLFDKYRLNDGKRREVLSASAAAGVAVAFGAPIGGVLFSLEEVSYYFPPKTLFRTFFCSIAAALTLKFLNPYGTGKIVLFQVRYLTDWGFFEIFIFAFLGMLGGLLGALFIKASRFWATHFRRLPYIKHSPIFEVFLVALVTGLISFWNRYTRLPVAELLYELAAPCNTFSESGHGLCPTQERIPDIIWYLCWAFVIKAFLTTVTFGIKLPAGIYVPSMVVGGLGGRIIGHTIQYFTLQYPHFASAFGCAANGNPEGCVVPGVYALVAAGATMCGVTRLSVTLAVILFELTGSLDHVLPFSLGVLIAKWTADAVEPLSIYDLLTDMNSYPFLDIKVRPVFTTELGDIMPAPRSTSFIDITSSPWIPAADLRRKLEYLHMSGELDAGFPVVRDGALVGLIPAPDLEFALDRLDDDDGSSCYMDPHERRADTAASFSEFTMHGGESTVVDRGAEEQTSGVDESTPLRGRVDDNTDFTCYIDPAPVALDVCSPMELVFECFVKLGLRLICVTKEGQFVGLLHKKVFVKYVKDLQEGEDRR